MHSTQRARCDATSILTRPFRSPLMVGPRQQESSAASQHDAKQGVQLTVPSPKAQQGVLPSLPPAVPLAHDATPASHPPLATENIHPTSHPGRLTSGTSLRRLTAHDPHYLALQRTHSRLLTMLKHVSASTKITAQALLYLNPINRSTPHKSDPENELKSLIQHWRSVSQSAAEELFTTAKERVDRMGGVGVFRDKYSDQRQNSGNPVAGMDSAWQYNQHDIDEDDLTADQQEQLQIAREEAEQEAQRYRILDGQDQADTTGEIKDDDSFTMDMMLKQLNVDLAVIGFDKRNQRWIEE